MPSSRSRGVAVAALAVVALHSAHARAAEAPQGFAIERFYPSAAGGGWFVMDALDMHGELGGAVAVTSGYALDSLRVTRQGSALAVVSNEAFADLGLALTLHRFRLYLDLDAPLVITGDGGTLGGYTFTPPAVGLGSTPDLLPDPRIGFDVRLTGRPGDPLRVGLGAQLILPSSPRTDYASDGTYRGMVRALIAGDMKHLSYAAQLGVHIRPLDEGPAPGSPEGSELLFGVAAGERVDLPGERAVIFGPEVFGATALRAFLGGPTTALEALMTARIEGTGEQGPQLRVKLGTGGGLDPQFGAPEWRVVVGVEVFGRTTGR